MVSRFHSRLSLKGRDVAQPEGICIPLAPAYVAQPEGICIPLAPALHFTHASPEPCFQPLTGPL